MTRNSSAFWRWLRSYKAALKASHYIPRQLKGEYVRMVLSMLYVNLAIRGGGRNKIALERKQGKDSRY